jgi:hypothetical protein
MLDQGVWQKIQENIPLWIAYATVSTLVGGTVAFIARRMLRHVGVAVQESPPHAPIVRPRTTWPADELARTFLADQLRDGFVVSPGTRLVVLERGVQQFALDPGTYDAGRVGTLFRRHAIKSAMVLQHTTSPFEMAHDVTGLACRGGQAFDATVKVSLRVDTATAGRVLEWHLARDGVVRTAALDALVWDWAEPWLHSRVATLGADDVATAGPALHKELERALNADVLSPNGLVAQVSPFALRVVS